MNVDKQHVFSLSMQSIITIDIRFSGHFGKVQPGLIWTSPLPVRARTFSLRPAALSCKIFLGGIPHDLHPSETRNQKKIKRLFSTQISLGDLQERLERFGSVRLEWPNVDNVHRNASNSNDLSLEFD